MPPKATQAATSEDPGDAPVWAVLRVRGPIDVRRGIEDTLKMLRLHHTNHAVIVPATATYRGMLHKVEHFVTYGEVTEETVAKMLETRGRLVGNKPVTDEAVAEHTDHGSIQALASAIAAGEVQARDIPAIKPVFRLSPPRGGFESRGKKRHFNEGGSLGYRGDAINELLSKMI